MGFLKTVFLLIAVVFVGVNSLRVKTGAGETVCVCTMDWNPVCASNGETYGNLCSFECARDEAVELGRAEIRLTNDNGACK